MAYDTSPSSELFQELLQCARYGDLEDLKEYTTPSYIPATSLATVLAQQDERGNTMLHYSCANGHIALVRHITPSLPAEALDIVNEGENTALHWASLNGHLDCVKVLLSAGADAKIINKARRMAVDEAEAQGKESVVLWFLALDMKHEKEALDAAGGKAEDMEEGTIKMTAGTAAQDATEDEEMENATTSAEILPKDDLDDLD